MFTHSTRRWLAGLGVAGAFVAASATPAVAAEDPFDVYAGDLLVAADHGKLGFLYVSPKPEDPEPKALAIDLDLSAVSSFATVDIATELWQCDTTGSKVHCEAEGSEEDGAPFFGYWVNVDSTAKAGTSGEVVIKVTADGKEVTRKPTVTVAEGIDLQSDESVKVEGQPGTTVGVPGVVRNAGPSVAHGAVLMMQGDGIAEYAGRYNNCRSSEFGFTICTFTADLETDQEYQLSEDFPVGLAKAARSGATLHAYLDWWAVDDWEALTKDPYFPEIGEPGTGGELRLVERPAKAQRAPQTDIGEEWNSSTIADIAVKGTHYADLAAVGGSGKGKVGDVVNVTPGFRNLGPALLEWQQEMPLLQIVVPTGTTAVDVSGECAPWVPGQKWNQYDMSWGEPGAKAYGCTASETPAGVDYQYPLALRIDKVVPNATGTVTLKLSGDPNSKNDAAAIVVNGTSGGNGGDGGIGGGAGDGGTLPITGSSTALIAGLGALLLAAGAGGYVVARRRKTRFVA
ncbi:LPXTG cell wall anchor domain-containing protein [Micromonospora coerulea]|uniref:LPXTG cell wall anchor domain-containing protein n=1 Tax=Micromonospora coerulea TaxID=47856 RepID=UPI001902DAE2|nr:LPXTG cell wall anchor domain-containing protein [Micromonospora veneta]